MNMCLRLANLCLQCYAQQMSPQRKGSHCCPYCCQELQHQGKKWMRLKPERSQMPNWVGERQIWKKSYPKSFPPSSFQSVQPIHSHPLEMVCQYQLMTLKHPVNKKKKSMLCIYVSSTDHYIIWMLHVLFLSQSEFTIPDQKYRTGQSLVKTALTIVLNLCIQWITWLLYILF